MAEIINWLRGGDIFIITLVRRNNQENESGSVTAFFPETLLDSPDFTQWVVKTPELAQSALNQIINEVSNQIKVSQENEYGIDVDSNLIYPKVNDGLAKKLPDCVLVVDLMGLGNTDKDALLTKGDYDSLYYRFYVTAFRHAGSGWE